MSKPELFPEHDQSWLDFNKIKTRASGIWPYTNKDNRIYFVIYRVDDKKGKHYWPISYVDGQYVNKQLWSSNKPLYKLHELAKDDRKVIIPEGEWACRSAQKLFPDYFVTTASGGCSNWHLTNWETLKGKDVTLWPDNDKPGRKYFLALARYLNYELGINAKIVNVPKNLPNKWDLADELPSNIDIHELVALAKIPDQKVKTDYEDIDEDIINKRWVFIADSQKLYWDRSRKTLEHEKNLNLFYKRDVNLLRQRKSAVNYLHENNVEVVDSTAYWPIEKEKLKFGGKTCLNLFRPHKLPKLDYEPKIELFKKFLFDLSNRDKDIFNELEDILSHDLQKTHENRTFCVVMHSSQGVGKSLFLKFVEKLHGSYNCKHVDPEMLVDRYRPFLKSGYVLLVNEVNISGQNLQSKLARLKHLIDGDEHSIEGKYVDTIQHRCHYRLYCGTNELIPFEISNDDRRTFYIDIELTQEDLKKEDPLYYDKLWALLDDDNEINKIYHHYKYVHQISKNFLVNWPLRTRSKEDLAELSRPQYCKDLDELLIKKEDPFNLDIINVREVFDRFKEIEDGWSRPHFSKLSERMLRYWLKGINAKKMKGGQAFVIKSEKKRYWAIRNQDEWRDINCLVTIRGHIEGILDIGVSKEKQTNELKNAIQKGDMYAY